MPIVLRQLTSDSDIEAVCLQMQPGEWAKDNEMTSYQPELLKKYLEAGGVLVLAYDSDKIAGAALCYEMPHPAGEHSLYVHELDTHPDYRRQGVATAIMQELMNIGRKRGLTELWVGTETTNKAADAFYKSLKPYEIEPSYIYAYKL